MNKVIRKAREAIMTLMRHDGNEKTSLLEPFHNGLFDWPLHPFEIWRHVIDEDTIKVEEFMDGNELVVRAELPGVDPDRDVEVSIVDGALCIRAERRQEHMIEERNMRRSELRYGSFSRTVALPPGARESDVKATYKDGLLEVRTPIENRNASSSSIPIERR
jgi:HSP20 family protein